MLPFWEIRNIEEKAKNNILDLQVFRYLLASWKIKWQGIKLPAKTKQTKTEATQKPDNWHTKKLC